jgi:hypothetical protein
MDLLNSLIQKYKDSKQKDLDKKAYKEMLLKAVSDGILSEDEITELTKKKEAAGLSGKDVESIKTKAYLSAFGAVKADQRATEEEERELHKIQKYLQIEDVEIEITQKELARLRLLAEIKDGNLPDLIITNLITQKGERIYWIEPAILAEEKVVRRRYEGGSQGVSLRIMKGVSYRVGASRGNLISDTEIVAVSRGEFIVTNKRAIFRGDGKSFAFKLDKLLDLQLMANGIYLAEANKAKPRMIKFAEEGNSDIIGAVLSHAINNYS